MVMLYVPLNTARLVLEYLRKSCSSYKTSSPETPREYLPHVWDTIGEPHYGAPTSLLVSTA